MKKKKLFTTICMTAFAFVSSGLQGKTVKQKKDVKEKQNTAKTTNIKKKELKNSTTKKTDSKVKITKQKSIPKAAAVKKVTVTKNSTTKNTTADTKHSSVKSIKSVTTVKHPKTTISEKTVKSQKNVKIEKNTTTTKKVSTNSEIYSIPENNKTQLLIDEMSELKRKHERIAKSGSASEKKSAAIEKKLLTSYSKWKGTKYQWGGDSKNGIDCSALTRRVYREVYNHELPRVSHDQVKTGKKVSSKELKAGDIVYFKPKKEGSHTAVYVGNNLFINASTSKGVVISSLKSPYWKNTFEYGVRVDKTKNV